MAHRESEQKAEEFIKLLKESINSEDQEEDEVIDIASQLLLFMPDDKDVLLCRAVAYIKSSEYQDALADLEKIPNCDFEKCLCIYGLKHYTDALKKLRSLPEPVRKEERFMILEEQILLSLEDSEGLKKFYAKTDFASLSPDVLKNSSYGLYITQDIENAYKVLAKNPRPNKSILYNLACLFVITQNIEKATELINDGLKRCEKKPESIFFQLFQILKTEIEASTEPEKAIESYGRIIDNEKGHGYCRQIAASNFTALTIDSSVHLAKKKMSLFDNTGDYEHMRRSEIESFLINRFLILHKIGQPGKAKALIDFAKKQNKIDPLIAESFERTIDPTKSVEFTKYTPLFEAQNLISQQKFCEAAEVLANSPLATLPRTVAVISDLYVAGENPSAAIEFLNSKADNGTAPFFDFAARFAIQVGFFDQGVKWAEKLVKVTGNSQRAIAIHSMCLSYTDIEMAERYISRIKVESASEELLDKLEELPIAKDAGGKDQASSEQLLFAVEKSKSAKKAQDLSPEKLAKLKEKKKKRRRLQKPEGYDPQRHMDPERWIKMKKRTGKKKTGKQAAAAAAAAAKPQQKKQRKGKKGGKNVW